MDSAMMRRLTFWTAILAALLLSCAAACTGCSGSDTQGERDGAGTSLAATSGALVGDSADETAELTGRNEVVVVLHGLGRTSLSMTALVWALENEGYQVLNWGYSSTCCTIEQLGSELADDVQNIEATQPDRIHFVGHSLGNIIVRWMLEHSPPEQPGHVVMLAPPNQGSETADRYAPWFGWLLEPLDELVTEEDSTARSISQLGDRPVGIIAGEHDGKVDVDETRLDAETDHETVPSAHTFIMNRPDVHDLVASFLDDGEF